MGKSASERAVIARAATVPLLKAQPVSHTSCATAQGLRFVSNIPTGEQL
jgi:hypothetical protein